MRYFILILALAGVVVSALALRVHYSTGTEPCAINEHWDCGIVNHSSFSMIDHVPVAAIGIAGYLVLGLPRLARRRFATFLAALAGLSLRLPALHDRAIWARRLVPLLRHLAGASSPSFCCSASAGLQPSISR